MNRIRSVVVLLTLALMVMVLLPATAFASAESLSLNNYQPGITPEYHLNYRVGNDLHQASEDYISLIFNDTVALPVDLSAEDFLVNSLPVKKIRTFQSRGQIDIFVPADIAANQPVDILIKTSAGIKNPISTGTYSISVWNSKINIVSNFFYTIVRGTINTPKVEVKPAITKRDAEYTCSFKVSQSGNLLGGTDSITITFPQEIRLPSYISGDAITVNGVNLASSDLTLSGNRLSFKVPSNISVGPEEEVTVKIKPEARIKSPDRTGEYRLQVATSKDPAPVPSEVFTIGETAISELKVSVDPPSAGAESQYEISFKTSPYGALKGGQSVITVTFPGETNLPSYIYKNSIEVQGILLDTGTVTLKGKSVSFVLPSNVQVEPNQFARITLKNAGIKNPNNPGSYNLKVSTSSDQQIIRSEDYTITGGKLITLVIDSITAYIDGKVFFLDVPPTILDGRTMIPVRFLAESLGARVEWDNDSREISIYLNDKNIKMTVNSKIATVNDKRVTLETVPVILFGRTMVPIRFIAENFGCEVIWDNKARSVIIKN
ncbi:MAG: copper amine oxidase N-terminal domain-containing protein [Bacillota bacterium]